jgi:hypothetical protein
MYNSLMLGLGSLFRAQVLCTKYVTPSRFHSTSNAPSRFQTSTNNALRKTIRVAQAFLRHKDPAHRDSPMTRYQDTKRQFPSVRPWRLLARNHALFPDPRQHLRARRCQNLSDSVGKDLLGHDLTRVGDLGPHAPG